MKEDEFNNKINEISTDDVREHIRKARNIVSNIEICCNGLRALVYAKAVVYFKEGTLWGGVPRESFALNYSRWYNGGCDCIPIINCPICNKKLKRLKKKKLKRLKNKK